MVNNGVSVAVVDASNEDEPDAAGQPQPCRYLASIANLPLIAHVLDGLIRDGIEKVLIVAGVRARQELASVVRGGEAWGVEVSFIDTGPDTTHAVVVSQLREAVADHPVLLHSGDCLFPGKLGDLHECFRAGDLDLVLLVRPVTQHPLSVTRHHDTQRKPPQPLGCVRLPRERPEGTALILGSAVWPVLEQLSSKPLSVGTLIESLHAGGRRVGISEVGEHWCYCGSAERLLVANRMLLDALPLGSTPEAFGDDSDAQGRVAIDPSARVSRSTLRGPVLIGANAVVEDSFLGPYTAIGPGAKVVGAEIDYAMVLADAQVRYPGKRLEASVIGERAIVSRSFALPSGLHLQLGPDARVLLG